MDDLMYLKSGTDIRGTAIEKDGKAVDLTDSRIESIVNSLVVFLKNKVVYASCINYGTFLLRENVL